MPVTQLPKLALTQRQQTASQTKRGQSAAPGQSEELPSYLVSYFLGQTAATVPARAPRSKPQAKRTAFIITLSMRKLRHRDISRLAKDHHC